MDLVQRSAAAINNIGRGRLIQSNTLNEAEDSLLPFGKSIVGSLRLPDKQKQEPVGQSKEHVLINAVKTILHHTRVNQDLEIDQAVDDPRGYKDLCAHLGGILYSHHVIMPWPTDKNGNDIETHDFDTVRYQTPKEVDPNNDIDDISKGKLIGHYTTYSDKAALDHGRKIEQEIG